MAFHHEIAIPLDNEMISACLLVCVPSQALPYRLRFLLDDSVKDRVLVLDNGKKFAEGTPQQAKANPLVIEAYLGREEVQHA